jgi:hypothetical protein
MLLPVGTIDHGTAKHHSSIGEVQNASTASIAQAGSTGKRRGHLAASYTRLTTAVATAWLAAG